MRPALCLPPPRPSWLCRRHDTTGFALGDGVDISIFLPYSPPYVMCSGWVGDQDSDFSGLQAALINVIQSGWSDYANFGCVQQQQQE